MCKRLFKVNKKNTRTTSVNFEHISYLFLVSLVDFIQVNVIWVTLAQFAEAYLEPSRTSTTELYGKIVKDF